MARRRPRSLGAMTALTDYLEGALLDHVLTNTAYTSPAAVYLALFSTTIDDDGTGTEAAGGSYARQAVTFTSSPGPCTNSVAVNFAGMPAGTWTHVALFDASSGGNMLLHAALSSSVTTGPGDAVNFPIGDLSVDLD